MLSSWWWRTKTYSLGLLELFFSRLWRLVVWIWRSTARIVRPLAARLRLRVAAWWQRVEGMARVVWLVVWHSLVVWGEALGVPILYRWFLVFEEWFQGWFEWASTPFLPIFKYGVFAVEAYVVAVCTHAVVVWCTPRSEGGVVAIVLLRWLIEGLVSACVWSLIVCLMWLLSGPRLGLSVFRVFHTLGVLDLFRAYRWRPRVFSAQRRLVWLCTRPVWHFCGVLYPSARGLVGWFRGVERRWRFSIYWLIRPWCFMILGIVFSAGSAYSLGWMPCAVLPLGEWWGLLGCGLWVVGHVGVGFIALVWVWPSLFSGEWGQFGYVFANVLVNFIGFCLQMLIFINVGLFCLYLGYALCLVIMACIC